MTPRLRAPRLFSVLAERALGTPNFASRGHQTGVWHPNPAPPIYPHTATAGDAQMRLPPAHLTRAPPPRHVPTKAHRDELQAAIESLPASSWALKRARTRPSLAAPLPAFAGDGITTLVLSSVFPPLPPVGGRPALARRCSPSNRRRPGELKAAQKVVPARGSAPSAQPRAATVRPPGLAYTG